MKFHIECYQPYTHVVFYTVRLDGETLSETEKFFQRFIDDPTFGQDLAEIQAIMRKMGNSRDGALEERFRFENNVRALPRTKNGLRLYCIRCHNNTVILCNGGKKTSQTTQDGRDVYHHYQLAAQIEKLYTERIQDKTIENGGRFINGNTHFDTDLF